MFCLSCGAAAAIEVYRDSVSLGNYCEDHAMQWFEFPDYSFRTL